MPFEKFKPPNLHAAIGTQIGKAQGILIAKGMKAVTSSTNKLRAKGCPGDAELSKLDNKLTQLSSLSGKVTANVAVFAGLPPGIRAPIKGILAAVDIILALPVPQAIGIPPGPPGGLIFAQPTNFTTKFADLLNLLKEFAAAMLITADAIELSLKDVANNSAAISNNLKALEAPLKVCKIENAMKSKLSKKQQATLGMLDENGDSIFATFGSKVLEKENNRSAKEQVQNKLKEKLGVTSIKMAGAATLDSLPKKEALNLIEEGTGFRLPPVEIDGEKKNPIAIVITKKDENGNTILDKNGIPEKEIKTEEVNIKPEALTGQAVAFAQLEKVLQNISDKISQPTSDKLLAANQQTASTDSSLTDTNLDSDNLVSRDSDGDIPADILQELSKDLKSISGDLITKEVETREDPDLSYKGYILQIRRTPETPVLAPRHFAVALKDGKVQLKGPNSFSSSKKVLLEEIKFRIDNQLS
jgi:hypothetical protein